jgi:NAD(P)-dependent dehydrogenase (short-subunit alcohol dehydrogenase family)
VHALRHDCRHRAATGVERAFGRLDVIVNNAGIGASDEASFITGAGYLVDGGYTAQ